MTVFFHGFYFGIALCLLALGVSVRLSGRRKGGR